jgi:hypothetical protein
MLNNKVSVGINTADKQAVMQNIAALQTQLQPVLLFNLTSDERLAMARMGDKTLSFVDKALTYAGQNPALAPSFLNLEEANKDFALATDLADIQKKLATLLQAVEDTLTVAGSEALEAGLVFYNAIKGAKSSNIAGAENIHNDLATHFPRRRSAKEATKQA